MADDLYNEKLQALQQYIPFLENMIAQLKDPKKKNREQQVSKMESLYAMITDKKRKMKLDTLTKCEDVLIKLYSKVKPNDKPVQHEGQKFHCRTPPNESKLILEKNREEKIKFEAARARLQELATPASPPSHSQSFAPTKPVLIPTEKVTATPASNQNWESNLERIPPVKRPDIYSSAAESLIGKPDGRRTSLDINITALTDLSKPPISAEDLELLKDDDEASETEKLSLTELEGLREEIQKKLQVKEKKKEKKHHKHSKSDRESEEKKTEKAKTAVRVEKVIKEPDSVFGSLLSSIDDKILGETKKKKERKSSTESKKTEDKKTEKVSKDESKKDSPKKQRSGDKKRENKEESDKIKPAEEHKKRENKETKGESERKEKKDDKIKPSEEAVTVTQPSEQVYKRLADKYNPKPRKNSVETTPEVDKIVTENVEKEMTIPFLESTFSKRPSSSVVAAASRPSLLAHPKVTDPRLKKPPVEIKSPISAFDSVSQQLHGVQTNQTVMGNQPDFLGNQQLQHNQYGVGGFNQIVPTVAPPFANSQPNPNQHSIVQRNQFQHGPNTYVNTYILQHNNMNQNQFAPVMTNNIQNNSFMNVFPQQQKKSFNPYDPISPAQTTTTTTEEYDLSRMQPVDFYNGAPVTVKNPLVSPPIAGFSGTNNNRPSTPFHQQRYQKEDRGRTNEFGDRDDRPPYQPNDRDPRIRRRNRSRNRPDFERNKSKYDNVYSKLSGRGRGSREESFTSPLDSLYTSSAGGSGSSTKGYGVQKFKIPKIRREEEIPKEPEAESKKEPEKEPTTEETTKKASPSEQSMLGEFIVNLLGNANKKEVLVSLFNTLADSLSNEQKKNFKRIQRIADDSESSADEAASESASKEKKAELERKEQTPTVHEVHEEKEIVAPDDDKKKKEEEEEVVVEKPSETVIETVETKEMIEEEAEEEEEEKIEEDVEEKKKSVVVKAKKKRGAPAKSKKKTKKKSPAKAQKDEKKNEAEPESSEAVEDVFETVGERIKSRKRKLKTDGPTKGRRHKTELDLLHDDIKDMFIRDGVLTATGKRMCRILKSDPEVVLAGSPTKKEETVAKTDSSDDDDDVPVIVHKKPSKQELLDEQELIKRKVRGSNPCVLLEKSDFSKLVAPKSVKTTPPKKTPTKKTKKRKADTDSGSVTSDASVNLSKKVVVLPKRNSLRRSAKMQLRYEEENSDDDDAKMERDSEPEEEEEEETSATKEVKSPKRKVKKPKSNWSKGVIIKKKRSKSATKSDRSSEASTPVPTDADQEEIDVEDDDNSEPEEIEPVAPSQNKETVLVEPDKLYYIRWNSKEKMQCKLCGFRGVHMINHYKVQHPFEEVFVARLSPQRAERVIKDATVTDYAAMELVELWEAKNRKKKFHFECVFCNFSVIENTEVYYDHLTTHTGEFRFHCSICRYKTASVKCLRSHMNGFHNWNVSCGNLKAACPPPPNYNIVIGYICTECNFVQLTKETVEKHVEKYHAGGKGSVRAINMSNVTSTAKIEKKAEEMANVKSELSETREEKEEKVLFVKQEPTEEVEKTLPEKSNKEKDDLNVFTCKTDINVENQKIEEERMKKMEEINQKVKQSRIFTSFVDKLKSRLENEKSKIELNEDVDPVDDIAVPKEPSPVSLMEKDLPEVDPVTPSNSGENILPEVDTTIIPKNNAPIGDTIQRLQGSLTNKPPPMININDLILPIPEPSKSLVLFSGCFEIRRTQQSDRVVFSCSMPTCIMITEDQELFRRHCGSAHSTMKLQDSNNSCSLCLRDPPVFSYIAECFDHVVEIHMKELLMDWDGNVSDEVSTPPQPLLRMRRLSGDLLSEVKEDQKRQEETESRENDAVITMDENSGFPFTITNVVSQAEEHNFPFSISNVMSLAPEEDQEEPDTDAATSNSAFSVASPPPLMPLSPGGSGIRISNVQSLVGDGNFMRLGSTGSKTPSPQKVLMVKKVITPTPQRILLKDHPMPVLAAESLRKDPMALKEMLRSYNIIHLYKCPQFVCSFSTNNRTEFVQHLDNHPEMKLTLSRCVYCNFGNRVEHIPVHIDVRHGNSLFLCPYCLYRAVCQSYVQVHVEHHHFDQPITVYKIPRNPHSKNAKAGLPKPALKELFSPFLFICGVESCRRRILLKDDLAVHMNHHVGKAEYTCPTCKNYKSPLTDKWHKIDNYVNHLVVKHSMGKYLCRYCKTCTENYNEIHLHMANVHPGLPFEIITRQHARRVTTTFPITSEKHYENLIHLVCEPAHTVNKEFLFDLSIPPVKALSKSKKDDVAPVVLNRLMPVPTETPMNVTCDEPLVDISQGSESHLVDPLSLDEETCNVVQQPQASASINVESDVDFDISTDDDENKRGLTGEKLFVCFKCKTGCVSSAFFKVHLLTCVDTSETSRPFKCVHCWKTFKSVNSIVEHVKVHGTSRFSCSLCDYKHPHHLQVRTHMRIRHKVAVIVITALDPKKNDMDKDEFIVRPKVTRKSTGESPGGAQSNKEPSAIASAEEESKITKTSYAPSEIESLPRQAIYSSELKCALCNYATKVRTNLVRHLEFHSMEKEVPTTAPVNPVPCLEKNEKMFDKMTNLALSSIAGASRTDKTEKIGLSKEEEALLPAFVPLTKRYVCGASGCSYLCLEESRLRHHIMALHADETSYTCKHCDAILSNEKTLNVDLAMKHLKLHDLHLYKCAYCMFVHNLRHKVERHLAEKHLDKQLLVIAVREMEAEPESGGGTTPVTATPTTQEYSGKPWHCCMCKYKSATREEVVTHAENKHDIGEQFKCALCTYKSATKTTFDAHFSEKHPGHGVDVIDVFYKSDDSDSNKNKDAEPFDTTPLWQRDRQRVRHIRGILFDESVSKLPKKPPPLVKINQPVVPALNNLDRAIEAVATGNQETRTADVSKKRRSVETVEVPAAKKVVKISEEIVVVPEKLNEDSVVILSDDEDIISDVSKSKSNDVVDLEESDDGSKSKEATSSASTSLQVTDELMGTFGPYGEPLKNKKYLCPLCSNFYTRNAEAVKFHLYQELQYPRYKCKICGKTAIDYKFFRRHFNRKHDGVHDPEKIEQLPRNPQIELWVETVLKVQKKLIEERKEPTEECNVISDDDAKATSSAQPEQKKPEEEEVEEVSSSSSVPTTPVRGTTSSPKKHSCPHCAYSCKNMSDLRKHERRHWLHKPLKCGYCSFTGITNSIIANHCRNRHKNQQVKIVPVPTPSTPTIVPVVGKRKQGTISDEDLDVVHLTSDEDGQEAAGPSSSDLKQYKCNICGHSSNNFLAISRNHVRWHFKPFQCIYCMKKFIHASQLGQHQSRVHPKEEFKCVVLKEEKEKGEQLDVHLQELREDGKTYGPLTKTRRKITAASKQHQRVESSVDKNNLLVVQKTIYTARKRTGPVTKNTARKSTTRQAVDSGFSYYKTQPDYGDLKKTMTTLTVNQTTMTMSIEQLSHIFDLYPEVRVVDCMKKDI